MSDYEMVEVEISKSTRKAFKKFVKRAGLIKPASWCLDKAVEFGLKGPMGTKPLMFLHAYNNSEYAFWFKKEHYAGPFTPLFYAAREVMRLDVIDEGHTSDFADIDEVFERECDKMFDACILKWLDVDPIGCGFFEGKTLPLLMMPEEAFA